jgi:hypothetical protein
MGDLFELIEQLLKSLNSEAYALISTITLGCIYLAIKARKGK